MSEMSNCRQEQTSAAGAADFQSEANVALHIKKEKSCGAVVIRRVKGGCLTLLIQHRGGHWGFPKGHVEARETEAETAIREIREETGLDVELDTGFRQSVVYSPREFIEKEVIYFTAITDRRETVPQPEEIRRADWFTFDEASAQLTHDNDIQILRNAQKYWKKKLESENHA